MVIYPVTIGQKGECYTQRGDMETWKLTGISLYTSMSHKDYGQVHQTYPNKGRATKYSELLGIKVWVIPVGKQPGLANILPKGEENLDR